MALTPRLPGCRLRVSCAGAVTDTESDSLGHFEATLTVDADLMDSPWQSYQVELLETGQAEPERAEGQILTPGPDARRIIVSDIDDTIIYTGMANKLKMLWRLFAQSAEQRVPFPHIDASYLTERDRSQ